MKYTFYPFIMEQLTHLKWILMPAKAFRFKLHRGPLDLRDDSIKKINMLIIFFLPSLYSSFRHLRRVIVSLVNKMTVLSRNGRDAPSYALDHWHGSSHSIIFIVVVIFLSIHKMCLYTCAQNTNNYFLAGKQHTDYRFSFLVYGKCLVSLQSRSSLRWPITGATIYSKVLPNDHSLNYVGFHIL